MRAFNSVATNRVPQFVKDDYPALNEFVEAYYEWLTINQINPADFKSIRDIDNTLDEYLRYFKNTLASGIPNTTSADYRRLISNIRQLFKSKGTEKSIKFFFKAFFNENVGISYPRDQMFVPSDATWIRNRVLKIDIGTTNIADFKEKELTFTHGSLYVKDCYSIGNIGVLQVSDIIGNIEKVSTVKLGNTSYPILKQVSGIKVINSGSYFKQGDTYNLSNGVSITISSTIRGPLTSLTIINGGSGYNGTEEIIFSNNGPYGRSNGSGAVASITQVVSGEITEISLTRTGNLYDLPPSVFIETLGDEATVIANGNIGGIKSVSIIDGGINLPPTPWQENIGSATIEMVYGNLVEQQGSFYDNVGFVSSPTAYLQDEHYYQYFSYVVKTGINIDQYSLLLKQLIHPAGMKLFSLFQIESIVSTISSLKSAELIIDLFSTVTAISSLKSGSIFDLYIQNKETAGGLKQKQVDLYEYKWFDESSYIVRWGDYIIRDLCLDPGVNPDYNSNTNIQPDLKLTLVNVASIAGFGDSIGNQQIGNTTIG